MPKPQYRRLPAYVLGAKRSVWNHIERHTPSSEGDGWVYFRVNALPQTIVSETGEEPRHHQTLARALAALASEGYIEYRPGNKGQASMARLSLGGAESTGE